MTQLSFQIKNAELVRMGLQTFEGEVPKVGRLQIYRAMQRAQKRLRKPGKKPTYPIPWDSLKQKRAFFATDGFGGGIPYKRTGKIVAGWSIVKLDDGYRLINQVDGVKYVVGDAYGQSQSRIHQGRWEVYRDVVEQELEPLPQQVRQEISMVAKRLNLR